MIARAQKTKSECYLEFLPMLNSGQVELLDHPRLTAQLLGVERRTARGGRLLLIEDTRPACPPFDLASR